jgi:DNA-binding protein HU-beta
LTGFWSPCYKAALQACSGRSCSFGFIKKNLEILKYIRGLRVNKSELIDAIAASADIPKAAAGRALDAVIESVTGALKAGDSVVLVGFGTFSVTDRPARTGRNPQTGKTLEIPAAKKPGFKAGKALKEAVN